MAGLFHCNGKNDAIVEQSGYRWVLGVFLFMVKRGMDGAKVRTSRQSANENEKYFHPKRCAVEKSVDNRKNIGWLLCCLGRVAYLCS